MEIVGDSIQLARLSAMVDNFGLGFVKAVVDVRHGLMGVDAELHSDLETALLSEGSAQDDLWGINLYPDMYGTEGFIEFDSLINIRPRQGNPSRDVLDEGRRNAIAAVVEKLVSVDD